LGPNDFLNLGYGCNYKSLSSVFQDSIEFINLLFLDFEGKSGYYCLCCILSLNVSFNGGTDCGKNSLLHGHKIGHQEKKKEEKNNFKINTGKIIQAHFLRMTEFQFLFAVKVFLVLLFCPTTVQNEIF